MSPAVSRTRLDLLPEQAALRLIRIENGHHSLAIAGLVIVRTQGVEWQKARVA
jgi:hypothetical protein